jgi:hypothetical protein
MWRLLDMSLKKMVAGDYGHVMDLTVYDVDTEAAADVSSYTTIQVEFKDPGGTVTTKDAAFATDGSDGVVRYTTASGDIHVAGEWAARVKLSKSGAVLRSVWEEFTVEDAT